MKQFLISFIFLLGTLWPTKLSATSLWVGETMTCDATSAVMGLTSDINWSVSGGNISLSGSGFYRNAKVTQYFSGSATIKCTWKYRLYSGDTPKSQSRTWTVSCNDNPVSISPTKMTLNVGETGHVSYSHQYSNSYTSAANAYFSTGSDCISLSSSGEIKALRPGTAYVNVYSKISSVSPYCIVTVKELKPTKIDIPSYLDIYIDETKKLDATIIPSGAVASLKWTTDNPNIAKVDSEGHVTGVSIGTTNICVATEVGDVKAYCSVSVRKRKLEISINPKGGIVLEGTKIEIIPNFRDANIFFTMDGSDPTDTGERYIQPFEIHGDVVVKAVAKHDKYITSDIITQKYNVSELTVNNIDEISNTVVGRTFHPTIRFNKKIFKGQNFKYIRLLTGNDEGVDGKSIIVMDNCLCFIPSTQLLSNMEYRLFIPESAICDESNNPNASLTIPFISTYYKQDFSKVAQIGSRSLVMDDGSLWVWSSYGIWTGNNDIVVNDKNILFLQNELKESYVPVKIIDSNVTWTTGQDERKHVYFIKDDSTLWGWGWNYDYCENSTFPYCYILGDGTKEPRTIPVLIASDVDSYIQDDFAHAIIKKDKSLWMWGSNQYGQIGNGKSYGDQSYELSPCKVMEDVDTVVVSNINTGAIKTDGTLWIWGQTDWKSSYTNRPTKIMSDVKKVSLGYNHYMILKNDGSLWMLGSNQFGQIGSGESGKGHSKSEPFKIMDNVIDITAGSFKSFAIKEDGSLWGWGGGTSYGIGLGYNKNSDVPVKIMENVRRAHNSNNDQMVIEMNDGSIWAWGYKKTNSNEELYTPELIFERFNPNKPYYFNFPIYFMDMDDNTWGYGANAIGDGLKEQPLQPIIIDYSTLPLVSIKLNHDTMVMSKGNENELQITIYPFNANIKSINYFSLNPLIASVSENGLVVANKEGETIIGCEVTDESGNIHVEECQISVIGDSGIGDIFEPNISISPLTNGIELNDIPTGSYIALFDLTGKMLYYTASSSSHEFVPIKNKGIYILRIGTSSYKLFF